MCIHFDRKNKWKRKSFGIKINIDLEATNVERKIYIYMAHFYVLWIEHSEVTHGPVLPPKKAKSMG